jgi:phosphoglycolate phosphatase-like HAD superfamily hydrolase
MPALDDSRSALSGFVRRNDFFIGIDSDGCAFDTMEVKHKECFIPNIVKCYRLAAISKYVRETAEFLNLYSKWRGINRFPGLVMTFDMVAGRPEVIGRRHRLPPYEALRAWVNRESTFSNPALQTAVAQSGDQELAQALEWSEAVNRSIAEIVKEVPPFPLVRESLEIMQGKADVMVVSATPYEALAREWEEHGLATHVALIAGQEHGTKRDHIALAAAGRYDCDKILMIGDALGDWNAAKANGALFYPIDPGLEDQSWQRFFEEAMPRFFAGMYAGPYMDAQIERFQALLPERPPWKSG